MNAFVSRSNSKKAERFVNVVKKKLTEFGVEKFCTPGRDTFIHGNLRNGIYELIIKNDIIVICLTENQISSTSHEFEIAQFNDKPTIVFVKTGIIVNPIMSTGVVYITFDGTSRDLNRHDAVILDFINSVNLHPNTQQANKQISENEYQVFQTQINIYQNNIVPTKTEDWKKLICLVGAGIAIYIIFNLASKKN
jgi:hypothetical protein